MFRNVAKVPVRKVGLVRDSAKGPGVITLEQADGKGSFKLNLTADECCGMEDAGELEMVLSRKVQDGQK